MAKKGKKRQLNEVDGVGDHASSNQNQNIGSDKKLHKKKKLELQTNNKSEVKKVQSAIKTVKKPSNDDILSNPAVVEHLKKSKKKNKKKPQLDKSSGDSENAKNDPDKLRKVQDGKVDESKKKERFKKKRQTRLEARKAARQEEGQHGSIMKMSVDELKKKIAEIESRESISKTGQRKLRILKVKLKVEEGTMENDQISNHKSNVSKKSETKILKQKSKNNKNENKTKNDSHAVSKVNKKDNQKIIAIENALFIEDRVGDTLENDENSTTKTKLSRKELKKLKKEENKKAKVAANKDNEKSQIKNSNKVNSTKSNENNSKQKVTNNATIKIKTENLNIDEDSSEEEDKPNNLIDKISLGNIKDSDDDSKNDNDEDNEAEEEEENESSDSNDASDDDEDNQKINKKKNKSALHTKNVNYPPKTNIPNEKFKKEKVEKSKQNKPKGGSEQNSEKKTRFVLFVGNLNYETTTVDLKKHFLTKVEKIKDVRIPSKSGTNTPRGFGYVEFENSVDYEKGLSLHRSTLGGRPINVMYTTSGSKNASKKQEVIQKNKKLHAMRKKGMLAGSKKDNQKRRRNFEKRSKKEGETKK